MKIFVFIFARGGSKRLLGKNTLLIGGKPLVQHSIDFALALDYVSKVWVSTDSEEIASIAETQGANVIRRPDYLCADDSDEFLSWKHAVNFVFDTYGDFEGFLSLPATSPLRNSEDIEKLVASLENNIELSLCITPSKARPDFNLVVTNANGMLSKIVQNQHVVYRHQDSVKVFELTTVGYFCRPSFILGNNSIWDGNVLGIEVPRERAVDIDDHVDFEVARVLMEKRK